MTFSATVLRVLIASPGDLSEERETATAAINAWNAQHALAEGVVLLPVSGKHTQGHRLEFGPKRQSTPSSYTQPTF